MPERLMEGRAISDEETLPKIIGCYNKKSYDKVKNIFEVLGCPIIQVKDARTAEFCKLTDNSFRNTQFAFSNEIAMHAAENNVDVIEVIKTINYGYARNNVQYPGFVSGYCLGKDPYIFEYNFLKSKLNRDFQSLWYCGRRVNDYMVSYVTQKVTGNISVMNPCIAILGVSFKEDVDDFRMSHVFQILDNLLSLNKVQFKLYDPNINKNKYTNVPDKYQKNINSETDKLDEAFFKDVDAIIISHRHQALNYFEKEKTLEKLLALRKSNLYIFDVWNIWRSAQNFLGVIYEGLGYSKLKDGQVNYD